MSSDRISSETPGRAFRALAEWRGGIKLANWLLVLAIPGCLTAGAFVYSSLSTSTETNGKQDTRIDNIEKRADEDRAEARRFSQWIADKLDRIADRVGASK
jgi:hypothetical protein